MADFVDYYEILQVSCTADPEVIEKAYKALIFKHHPDRGGSEAEAKTITGAYYVLSDRQRRNEYDHKYRAWRAQSSGVHAGDRPAPVVHQVPPEIIDAILAATWLEGAAATARTAARVAGTVAVAGAASVVEAAVSLPTTLHKAKEQKRRDVQWRRRLADQDADRQCAIRREAQRLGDHQAQAEKASRTWSPRVSAGAVTIFAECLSELEAWVLESLSENELLWLAFRHPWAEVRREAIRRLGAEHPGQVLVAHLSRRRVVELDPTSMKSEGVDTSWQPEARSAELVNLGEMQLLDARSRRSELLFWARVGAAVVAVIVVVVALWVARTGAVAAP